MNTHDKAIQLLAKGFAEMFVHHLEGNEKIQEAFMDAAYDFVKAEIPIVSEVDVIDVAAELLCNVHIAKN